MDLDAKSAEKEVLVVVGSEVREEDTWILPSSPLIETLLITRGLDALLVALDPDLEPGALRSAEAFGFRMGVKPLDVEALLFVAVTPPLEP